MYNREWEKVINSMFVNSFCITYACFVTFINIFYFLKILYGLKCFLTILGQKINNLE